MNRAEYVTQIAGRSGIGTHDSLYSEVPSFVDQAIRGFSLKSTAGWDWLWQDVDLALTADQTEYAFSDIGALLDINTALDAGATPFPVVRIGSVLLVTDEGRARFPRQSRAAIEERCGRGWFADAQKLRLWPSPDGSETLRLRVLVAERPLESDDEAPLVPDVYSEVVIHLGRALAYERKQDDERALSARKLAETMLPDAIMFSGPMGASTPMGSETG